MNTRTLFHAIALVSLGQPLVAYGYGGTEDFDMPGKSHMVCAFSYSYRGVHVGISDREGLHIGAKEAPKACTEQPVQLCVVQAQCVAGSKPSQRQLPPAEYYASLRRFERVEPEAYTLLCSPKVCNDERLADSKAILQKCLADDTASQIPPAPAVPESGVQLKGKAVQKNTAK